MIFLHQIDDAVCSFYGLDQDSLRSGKRNRAIAFSRFVAVVLTRRLTKRSYPEIAAYFGGRDHTSMIHAYRRGLQLESETLDYALDLAALRQVIEAKAAKNPPPREAAMRATRRAVAYTTSATVWC